ncbi:MAG: hypothetical protein Q7T34_02095 [Candidatus Parcubacteria bacterium]|nr:hypothetical protein [Candidatus Parcubacteria bacterium]
MQAFELHFNPKKVKGDIVFDSFCFEPENIIEKSFGNLYIVGQLSNVLPQNSHFLDDLANYIKQEYYLKSQKTPEQSLTDSLRKANEFLSNAVKDGNVNWMGNLDFFALSIQNFVINFAKTGDISVLLFHDGEIIDMGSNLEYQDTQTLDPLKVFGNIASGKVLPGDKIAVLTPKILDFLKSQNLMEELALISEEKSLKEFLSLHKEELLEIYGTCLILIPGGDINQNEMINVRTPEIGSLFKLTASLKNLLARCSSIIKSLIGRLKSLNLFKNWKLPKIKIPNNISLPKIPKLPNLKFNISDKEIFKEKLILILKFIIILIIGFLIFRGSAKREIPIEENLPSIESKMRQAENLVILHKDDEANILLQEALTDILILENKNRKLSENALDDKKTVMDNLDKLNNVAKIQNPEVFTDIGDHIITPQKILLIGTNLLTSELFFSKPNTLLFLNSGQWQEQSLSDDYEFADIALYGQNIYLLDSKNGEIIKFSAVSNTSSNWLEASAEKIIGAKSIAVDGNIWILTGDNKIDRYLKGKYMETLDLTVFPGLDNALRIRVSSGSPYLFIMDNKRVVIMDKQGNLIKQYQSEAFDNLIDFEISPDGKEIHILNGNKIYLIKP